MTSRTRAIVQTPPPRALGPRQLTRPAMGAGWVSCPGSTGGPGCAANARGAPCAARGAPCAAGATRGGPGVTLR